MGFSQALQKRVKIRFAVKYILAASASTHHMITDDFVFDAKWASHAVENYRILIVKSRFDPIFDPIFSYSLGIRGQASDNP